jgi:hypothetical protein
MHLLGGSFHWDAGNCWASILLFLALTGGIISLGCWQLPALYFTIFELDFGGYSFYDTG